MNSKILTQQLREALASKPKSFTVEATARREVHIARGEVAKLTITATPRLADIEAYRQQRLKVWLDDYEFAQAQKAKPKLTRAQFEAEALKGLEKEMDAEVWSLARNMTPGDFRLTRDGDLQCNNQSLDQWFDFDYEPSHAGFSVDGDWKYDGGEVTDIEPPTYSRTLE